MFIVTKQHEHNDHLALRWMTCLFVSRFRHKEIFLRSGFSKLPARITNLTLKGNRQNERHCFFLFIFPRFLQLLARGSQNLFMLKAYKKILIVQNCSLKFYMPQMHVNKTFFWFFISFVKSTTKDCLKANKWISAI